MFCKENTGSSPQEIDPIDIPRISIPTELLRNVRDANYLSDLFELDRSIVLEISDPSSIISDIMAAGSFDFIKIRDDNIYILDDKSLHLFDKKGRYVQRIGMEGTGLGRYNNPSSFAISEEHIIIADYLAADNILFFNLDNSFCSSLSTHRIRGTHTPEWIFPISNGYIFYTKCFDISSRTNRIALVDKNLRLINSFGKFEKYHEYLNLRFHSSAMITRLNTIWITNNFKPTINIYDFNGRLLREVGDHLFELGFGSDERLLKQMRNAGHSESLSLYNQASPNRFFKKLVNYNDQLVLSSLSYNNEAYYDVYDINGDYLNMIKRGENIKGSLASAYGKYLVFIDMWSEDIELDDDINAVLYFYKIKSR